MSKTFALLLAVLSQMPGTAVGDSREAASRAEAAATLAQQHSIGFEDDGTGLILSPIEEV